MKKSVGAIVAVLLMSIMLLSAIPSQERNALIAIYNSTDGANWTNNTGWMGAPGTECQWWGVVCNQDETHVVELRLNDYPNGNNLVGTIPSGLGHLSELEVLDLAYNQLSGTIPSELGQLNKLELLLLYLNDLEGSIPTTLGQCLNLDTLRINHNNLSGPIPTELGNLANLRTLWLYNNQLSGHIPSQLGNVSKLQDLSLSSNQLTGPIPSELANTAIYRLNLQNNMLTGKIPSQLSLLNLQWLFLQNNQLSGDIPSELGNMETMSNLQLGHNKLSGPIPPELANLTNLEWLSLADNQLAGRIPASLGEMDWIQGIYLQNNRFSGAVPSELGNCVSLQDLILNGNLLTGEVPEQFMSLSLLRDPGNSSGLRLDNNALHTDDNSLRTFINEHQYKGDFEATQTIAPGNVTWTPAKTGGELHWDVIPFADETGRYEVRHSTIPGGPYEKLGETPDKETISFNVADLDLSRTHFFVVRTVTENYHSNNNTVSSEFSPELRVGPELVLPKTYAAHVADDALWGSRLTVVNLGQSATDIVVAAVNETGELVETTTLAAVPDGGVVDASLDTLFSPTAFEMGVWVTLACAEPVYGVVSFGTKDDETMVTIPITEAGSRELVFPYVISSESLGYFTGITLINTEVNAATVLLEALTETGRLLDREAVLINGSGKFVRLLGGLFDVDDVSQVRFIRISSDRPLVGFEIFGSYADAGMAGLPAHVPPPASRTGEKTVNRVIYNEVLDPMLYYTGVTVSNLGAAPTDLHATLRSDLGVVLQEKDWPGNPVDAGEQVTREIWDFFNGAGDRDAAWMEIASPDQPLMGFEIFLSRSGNFRFDGILGVNQPSNLVLFPLIKSGADWQGWLRVTNPDGIPVEVRVEAYDATGQPMGTISDTLAPYHQFRLDIAQAIPGPDVAWIIVSGGEGGIVADLRYESTDSRRMSGYNGVVLPDTK